MILYIFKIEKTSRGFSSDFYKIFKNITKYLNSQIIRIHLPIKKKKIIVLKSPHIFKKAREQFEKVFSRHCFYILHTELVDKQFLKFVKLFSWSFLNISINKKTIKKKYIYF